MIGWESRASFLGNKPCATLNCRSPLWSRSGKYPVESGYCQFKVAIASSKKCVYSKALNKHCIFRLRKWPPTLSPGLHALPTDEHLKTKKLTMTSLLFTIRQYATNTNEPKQTCATFYRNTIQHAYQSSQRTTTFELWLEYLPLSYFTHS